MALALAACADDGDADDADADEGATEDTDTEADDAEADDDADADEAAAGDDEALDEFPCDRVDFIVPQNAGGGSDLYSRTIAQAEIGRILDTQVDVRNVPGDAQMLGLSEVARAGTEGCTWTTFNPPSVTLSILSRGDDAPVDVRDFGIVGSWATSEMVVAAHPSAGVTNLDEVKEAYDSGEQEIMCVQDTGGISHIYALLMQSEWGINFSDIVHFDSSEIIAALLREECMIGVTSGANLGVTYGNDELEGIASLSDLEPPVLPGVKPAIEQGDYESLAFLSLTRMLATEPGTPEPVRQMIEDALEEAIASDAVQEWSEESGNPADFLDGATAREILESTFSLPERVDGLEQILADAND
ncbi:MAG: tripartite tricarboxylate transporter substrate-binding protein [Chloroflexota bacterium]